MNWIKQKLLKAFLLDGGEKLLARLPFNNKKTIIGAALTIVLIAIEYLGGAPTGTIGELLTYFAEWLQSMGAVSLLDSATIILISGLVHKIWKWIKKWSDAKAKRS